MLIALRDWRQTGVNSIGASRSDIISPILKNISLLQAERIARQRELGDKSPQQTVLERIKCDANNAHAPLNPSYDPTTGGCRDDLHADRPNENQGAESTLAFLQALLELRLTENAVLPVEVRPL